MNAAGTMAAHSHQPESKCQGGYGYTAARLRELPQISP
jgi:hypothetical protein